MCAVVCSVLRPCSTSDPMLQHLLTATTLHTAHPHMQAPRRRPSARDWRRSRRMHMCLPCCCPSWPAPATCTVRSAEHTCWLASLATQGVCVPPAHCGACSGAGRPSNDWLHPLVLPYPPSLQWCATCPTCCASPCCSASACCACRPPLSMPPLGAGRPLAAATIRVNPSPLPTWGWMCVQRCSAAGTPRSWRRCSACCRAIARTCASCSSG